MCCPSRVGFRGNRPLRLRRVAAESPRTRPQIDIWRPVRRLPAAALRMRCGQLTTPISAALAPGGLPQGEAPPAYRGSREEPCAAAARLHAQDGLAEYRLRPLHANPLVCGRATPAYLGRLVSRTPENASHVFPTFGVLAGKSLAKRAFAIRDSG